MLSVLCVVAHPDDETILAGGVLAMLAARGAAVDVVCATRGEGGELGDPPVERAQLGRVREAEMVCAVGKLKGRSLTFFDYVDPTVEPPSQDDPAGRLYPFEADLTVFAGQIAASIRQYGSQAVLTHGSNGEYGHPAHRLVHTAAEIAVASFYSLIPDPSPTGRGEIDSQHEKYASAKPPLPPELLARCRELRQKATDAERKRRNVSPQPDSPLPEGEGQGVRAKLPVLYSFSAAYPDHPFPRLTNADDPAHFVVDVTPWLDAKEAAALCHTTQTPLFIRRRSEAAGRRLTVREVLLAREGLHRHWPAAEGALDDPLAAFLRTRCGDVII